jgi:hypothetical protein
MRRSVTEVQQRYSAGISLEFTNVRKRLFSNAF